MYFERGDARAHTQTSICATENYSNIEQEKYRAMDRTRDFSKFLGDYSKSLKYSSSRFDTLPLWYIFFNDILRCIVETEWQV